MKDIITFAFLVAAIAMYGMCAYTMFLSWERKDKKKQVASCAIIGFACFLTGSILNAI